MLEYKKESTLCNLLTPQEVGKILGISAETLNTWRATNRYPLPYIKAGRLVRYRSCDVEAFINSRMQGIPPPIPN